MKKIIALFLSLALILVYVIPTCSFADENVVTLDVEYVSYKNYKDNEDYYNSKILQGHAVGISFDSEYTDEQIQALLKLPASSETSVGTIQPRGTSIPTTVHNIHEQGSKEIHADADNVRLWSNNKYTGCTFYLIQLFNYDYNNTLRVRVFGTSDGTVDFSVAPRSGINYAFHTDATTDEFYFYLDPPSHADGYVFCCPAS